MSAPTSTSTIGFVGLGAMGFGMATHLLSCGYKVKGFDIYEPLLKKFETRGGIAVSSPMEAAQGSKVFVIMVANADQVSKALFHVDGAVKGLEPGSVILLCSTVAPEDVFEFRSRIPKEIHFIDAPVSGGAGRAADGTLTILASGPKDEIDLAKPVLKAMAGKDTLHIIPGASGDSTQLGKGMKAKTVHQALAGIHITMTGEALGFARALGLDVREVIERVTSPDSPGYSWMFQHRTSTLLSEDKSIRSLLNIIVKDMGIVTAVARSQKVPVFLSSAAEQVLVKGVQMNFGLEDDAYLYRVYTCQGADVLQTSPRSSPRSTLSVTDEQDFILKMLKNVHLAATAEALNFGSELGLGGWDFYHIVEGAAGASAMFITTAPAMLRRDFSRQDKKDVPSILEAIEDLTAVVERASMMKFSLPITTTALQMFQQCVAANGLGDESHAAIIKFFDRPGSC